MTPVTPVTSITSPLSRGEGPRERRQVVLLILLLTLSSCLPDVPPPPPEPTQNLVLLTDTTYWLPGELNAWRDSVLAEDYRLIVSGFPGETAADLVARLPWLLQPGVDRFVYDPRLAGPEGYDSLQTALTRWGHHAEILRFSSPE